MMIKYMGTMVGSGVSFAIDDPSDKWGYRRVTLDFFRNENGTVTLWSKEVPIVTISAHDYYHRPYSLVDQSLEGIWAFKLWEGSL